MSSIIGSVSCLDESWCNHCNGILSLLITVECFIMETKKLICISTSKPKLSDCRDNFMSQRDRSGTM